MIKEYVAIRKEKIRERVGKYSSTPSFTIIQVNDDPASDSYIRGKIKDATEVGIETNLLKLPVSTTEAELFRIIDQINDDDAVHGLIVQMPLPRHINEEEVKIRINPKKDIDGFHPLSKMDPCTPKGIMNFLITMGVNLSGANAVVIGRSNIVGKPMAKLLLRSNANTTILHSKTSEKDMKFYLRHADIVVVAVGKSSFLNANYKLKKSAVLLDVGINRTDAGLTGDIEPNLDVRIQTPVPGGVGLITRLTLLENLLEAYENGI